MMSERVTDEELTMLALKSQSRLIDVEKENVVLRQLVKDWKEWADEGFLLLSNTQKIEWEKRYEVLRQSVLDLLGVESL